MLSVRNLSTFIKLRHNRTFQKFFWKSAEFPRWTRTTPSFPRENTGVLYIKSSILRNDKDVIRGWWGSRDSVGKQGQCRESSVCSNRSGMCYVQYWECVVGSYNIFTCLVCSAHKTSFSVSKNKMDYFYTCFKSKH